MSMLKTVGVTAEWTWERVMRETVTEPLYKALKTLSERKAAFEKYVVESKREEQEERERSLERCRKDWFKAMDKLGGGPTMETGVKTWWSWDRGRRELEAKFPETFKGPRNDKERETLFLEYIDALRKKEEVRSALRSPWSGPEADCSLLDCRLINVKCVRRTCISCPTFCSHSSSTWPVLSAGKMLDLRSRARQSGTAIQSYRRLIPSTFLRCSKRKFERPKRKPASSGIGRQMRSDAKLEKPEKTSK